MSCRTSASTPLTLVTVDRGPDRDDDAPARPRSTAAEPLRSAAEPPPGSVDVERRSIGSGGRRAMRGGRNSTAALAGRRPIASSRVVDGGGGEVLLDSPALGRTCRPPGSQRIE